jgi:hypothetical protein
MHRGKFFVAVLLMVCGVCHAQERIDSGPFKGFLQEHPALNYVEISAPFQVSKVQGKVYAGDKPIGGAAFEIRVKDGRVLSVLTDSNGAFEIANLEPGTYPFKVTKDGFHSTIGKIVVSRRISPLKAIMVQLHIGT